ncbi:MAG: flagellar biosynthesis protein FlhF [Lachnospiraceae bacterium]|nr:flagellar biosynthesis protein FlhF [Lachnospiraceae bacterium]
MIIKKFTAKTETEALALAKKELGDGVVTMSTKKVKQKGFFSFFKGKLVEVTVALEDDKEQPIDKAKQEIRDAASIIEAANRVVAEKKAKKEMADSISTPAAGGAAEVKLDNTESIEKKLDNLQSLLESQFAREKKVLAASGGSEGENDKTANDTSVANEDKSATTQESSEREKFFELLKETMEENEVDKQIISQIMDDVLGSTKENTPFDYILAGIYQKLILKFGTSDGITPAEKGPKTVFFVGPTGVGKTTTIAKIASNYSIDKKKKVALLTTDTYRIAASEQLHTYANILEVSFRVVYTEEEFEKALDDFKLYDYIFVDTAGHSHTNEEQMKKMASFVETAKKNVEYQVFLVLSTTTKYKDLKAIAASYKKYTEYQLIFTKLDETDSYGNLLNVRLNIDTPIAYVTYGQNVPDDIESFNAQKTVKHILGGK